MEKRPDGTIYPDLNQEEIDARSKDKKRIQTAQTIRDAPHKEWDGMDYVTRYETNAQADMGYLPPKLNRTDTRVTTGTTREKDNSLLSALLSYNFEADITAFDKNDDERNELGGHFTDLVRNSREREMYDQKRALIYREMIVQGDVFTMEEQVTKYRIEKKCDFDLKQGVRVTGFKFYESNVFDYRLQ